MSTLTDRYVHAVSRAVPESRRRDLSEELRASIDDMVAARTDAGEPTETAERAVLTELGEPERLASRYTGAPLQLIGPRYYVVWRRLMILGLAWVPATVAVVAALIELTSNPTIGSVIGTGVAAAVQSALHVVFWVTLAFAILERVDVDPGLEAWSVDKLPPVRGGADRQVPWAEPIAAIVFFVILLAFLLVQQLSPLWTIDGERMPLLDPDLWSGWMWVVLASIVLSIGIQAVLLLRGRWSFALVGVNIVSGLLFAVPVVYLVADRALLNPALVDAAGFAPDPYRYASLGIAVGVGLALAYDMVDAFIKAFGARRSGAESPHPVR